MTNKKIPLDLEDIFEKVKSHVIWLHGRWIIYRQLLWAPLNITRAFCLMQLHPQRSGHRGHGGERIKTKGEGRRGGGFLYCSRNPYSMMFS